MQDQPQQPKIPTTIGNRLASAAAIGGLYGGGFAAINSALNGGIKLLWKEHKVFSRFNIGLIGVVTGISAIFGFLTADKEKETQLLHAMDRAQAKLNNPDAPGSQQEKQAEFSKSISMIMDGKIPAELQEESTKFRDQVTQRRVASQASSASIS